MNARSMEPKVRCGIAVVMKRLLCTVAAMLAMAGCGPMPPAPYQPPPNQPQGQYPPANLSCPVVGSGDWNAWVNAMPGPNARPTLIITGKVTVPTGGYRFVWRDIRVMESYPVSVATELEAVPATGGATQAILTHEVRGQWPIDPPVGSVTVRCGDMVLVHISPVETAQ